jgi:hypothetical protein|tara:strand:- start:403 stop:543 length:141 start_codon:yes stop_codon:yes gene_type:complete
MTTNIKVKTSFIPILAPFGIGYQNRSFIFILPFCSMEIEFVKKNKL